MRWSGMPPLLATTTTNPDTTAPHSQPQRDGHGTPGRSSQADPSDDGHGSDGAFF